MRELSYQDEKYCFEITVNSNDNRQQSVSTTNTNNTKLNESYTSKRHIFAAENEGKIIG